MDPITPPQPATGTTGWGEEVNEFFAAIAEAIPQAEAEASDHADAAVAGEAAARASADSALAAAIAAIPGPPDISGKADKTYVDAQDATKASRVLRDTLAVILATPPEDGARAWATDMDQLLIADGAAWWELSAYLAKRLPAPSMGSEQESNRQGYAPDYVTDKVLANCAVGSNAILRDGAVRFNPDTGELQLYRGGTWAPLVSNFRFKETAQAFYALEQKPVGFTSWIEVFTGNGEDLGLNGMPLIQGYRAAMGAFPAQPMIAGGSF